MGPGCDDLFFFLAFFFILSDLAYEAKFVMGMRFRRLQSRNILSRHGSISYTWCLIYTRGWNYIEGEWEGNGYAYHSRREREVDN